MTKRLSPDEKERRKIERRERDRAARRAWREANPEAARRQAQEWAARNREQPKARRRERVEAHRAHMKQWRADNKERIAKSTKAWRRRNRLKLNKQARDRAAREREKRSLRRRLAVVSEAGYVLMLKQQDGLCAVCKNELPIGRGRHVDHDHGNGSVRGVLCTRCNSILGFAHDNETVLQNAIEYLWLSRLRYEEHHAQ